MEGQTKGKRRGAKRNQRGAGNGAKDSQHALAESIQEVGTGDMICGMTAWYAGRKKDCPEQSKGTVCKCAKKFHEESLTPPCGWPDRP
jgi:hypothetical protein